MRDITNDSGCMLTLVYFSHKLGKWVCCIFEISADFERGLNGFTRGTGRHEAD